MCVKEEKLKDAKEMGANITVCWPKEPGSFYSVFSR